MEGKDYLKYRGDYLLVCVLLLNTNLFMYLIATTKKITASNNKKNIVVFSMQNTPGGHVLFLLLGIIYTYVLLNN